MYNEEDEIREATFRILLKELFLWLLRVFGYIVVFLLWLSILVIVSAAFLLITGDLGSLNEVTIVITFLSSFIYIGYILLTAGRTLIPYYYEVCTPPYCYEIIGVNNREYMFLPSGESLDGVENLDQSEIIKERQVSSVMFIIHMLLLIPISFFISVAPDYKDISSNFGELIEALPWFVQDLYWGLLINITPYTPESLKEGKGAEFMVVWIMIGPGILAGMISISNLLWGFKSALEEDPAAYDDKS